jgi:catechol-2,3-dioxygenase
MKRAASSALATVVLFVRDLDTATAFYSEGVGLRVAHKSPQVSELRDTGSLQLLLARTCAHGELAKGYSPILQFRVASLADTLLRLQKYSIRSEGPAVTLPRQRLLTLVGTEGELLALSEATAEEDEPQGGQEQGLGEL